MVDDRPSTDGEPESCSEFGQASSFENGELRHLDQHRTGKVPQDLPPEMLALLMQLNDRRADE